MSDEHIQDAPTTTHPPIPGLRAMAIVRWALFAVVMLIAIATWWRFVLVAEHASDDRPDRYYCPMHPQIRSPDPGSCPICYMTLEPIPDHAAHVAHDAGAADAGPEPLELGPVMLTTERRQRAGIATVPARRLTIGGTERWPASIEADEGARAEARVRANAFVERIAVRQSNVLVRRGQPLAWVYSPEIVRAQEELLVAHRWAQQGAEAAATQSAARDRLVLLGMSDADIDAMLASGRASRTIPVRAPIGGRITRFEAVVGSYATPEMRLYEITDFARVRIVASPHSADPSSIEPGLHARFVPRSDPSAAIPVTLELVEPAVDADTRTLRVRFTPDEAAHLRPDDIGVILLERAPREALVVPRDAVIDTGTHRYVYVERSEGLFEPRTVELGALEDEQRVITSGLEPGERVVARGAFVLDSESRLQSALAPSEASHAHHEEATP